MGASSIVSYSGAEMGVEAILGALAVGGSVLKGVGAIQQGNAASQASEFNATVAEQQARAERDASAAEARDYNRGERRKLASSTAALGGTGVVSSAGSPLLVTESTIREIALGVGRIRQGGEAKATRLEQDAELSRMNARSSPGYLSAGSSILSSAGSWYGSRA